MRSHRTLQLERDEAQRILNNLVGGMVGYNANVTRRIAQKVLLHTPIMRMGRLYEIKCKHLGAGVYRISLGEEVNKSQ